MRTVSSTTRSLLAAAGVPPAHYGEAEPMDLLVHRPAPVRTSLPLPPRVDAYLTAPGEAQLRWQVSSAVAPRGFFIEWQEFATSAPEVWHPFAVVPAHDALTYTLGLREMPPGRFRFRVGMRTAVARVISLPVEVRISTRPPGWVSVSGGRPGDGRILLSIGVAREQTLRFGLYDAARRLVAMPPPLRVLPGPTAVLPISLEAFVPGTYTLIIYGEGWEQHLTVAHDFPHRVR